MVDNMTVHFRAVTLSLHISSQIKIAWFVRRRWAIKEKKKAAKAAKLAKKKAGSFLGRMGAI